MSLLIVNVLSLPRWNCVRLEVIVMFLLSIRDHSWYALGQWEQVLHCNAASHWLCAYTEHNDHWLIRDHSVHVFSQWEPVLHRTLLAVCIHRTQWSLINQGSFCTCVQPMRTCVTQDLIGCVHTRNTMIYKLRSVQNTGTWYPGQGWFVRNLGWGR